MSCTVAQAGLLHQRDHGRGIDAARQKGAKRHIGDHAPLDGVLQQRLELVGQFGIAAVERIESTPSRAIVARVPEAARSAARLATAA